ncbi:MAG: FG-GAP-like repeat-containing protein [Steroidobacteraceae bacterium]
MRTVQPLQAALPLLASLLLAACSGGSAGIHQAPSRPTAEPGPGEVTLTWNAVPEAKSYTIRWENEGSGQTGFPNRIEGITDTTFLHTGLTNGQLHRYQIYAKGKGGEGPGSVVVSAEPGPIPAALEWATVVIDGPDHRVYFDEVADATGYRVYYATSADALIGRRPSAGFLEATGSPFTRTSITGASYYKVIAMSGPRFGLGGPVAISPSLLVGSFELPALSPALADANADDCLDLPAAEGACNGSFEALDPATAGLGELFAADRINGDSRFADLNADGLPELFTATRSAATDANSRAILHLNQGDNVFQADAGIDGLGIGGFGGTILAADFDNDGDVDLFVPNDSEAGDGGRNWLLINTGSGLVDGAAAAGLLTNPAGAGYVPAGGQAADVDADGDVDLLFGSRLMLNNGDGSFADGSAAAGLTVLADQGLALADVDLDGDLDLIRRDASVTRLQLNTNGAFGAAIVIDGDGSTAGAGLAVCDLNSDAFPDVALASNDVATGTGTPRIYLNANGQFVATDVPRELEEGTDDLVAPNGLLACADLDGSRVPELVAQWDQVRVLRAGLPLLSAIRLRVLGAGGERNQQGRMVRITPAGAPGRIITRVIESGSGLRAQGAYDLLIGAPWGGDYEVSVRFADGWFTTTAQQGQSLTLYADGRVVEGLE